MAMDKGKESRKGEKKCFQGEKNVRVKGVGKERKEVHGRSLGTMLEGNSTYRASKNERGKV